jgi:uncharacterized surface protein with fasciclin (FAS1) repeats
MDQSGDFMTRITQMQQLTLFAPSNLAWKNPNLRLIRGNPHKMRDILNMHLVAEKLPLERIISENRQQVRNISASVLSITGLRPVHD